MRSVGLPLTPSWERTHKFDGIAGTFSGGRTVTVIQTGVGKARALERRARFGRPAGSRPATLPAAGASIGGARRPCSSGPAHGNSRRRRGDLQSGGQTRLGSGRALQKLRRHLSVVPLRRPGRAIAARAAQDSRVRLYGATISGRVVGRRAASWNALPRRESARAAGPIRSLTSFAVERLAPRLCHSGYRVQTHVSIPSGRGIRGCVGASRADFAARLRSGSPGSFSLASNAGAARRQRRRNLRPQSPAAEGAGALSRV